MSARPWTHPGSAHHTRGHLNTILEFWDWDRKLYFWMPRADDGLITGQLSVDYRGDVGVKANIMKNLLNMEILVVIYFEIPPLVLISMFCFSDIWYWDLIFWFYTCFHPISLSWWWPFDYRADVPSYGGRVFITGTMLELKPVWVGNFHLGFEIWLHVFFGTITWVWVMVVLTRDHRDIISSMLYSLPAFEGTRCTYV